MHPIDQVGLRVTETNGGPSVPVQISTRFSHTELDCIVKHIPLTYKLFFNVLEIERLNK